MRLALNQYMKECYLPMTHFPIFSCQIPRKFINKRNVVPIFRLTVTPSAPQIPGQPQIVHTVVTHHVQQPPVHYVPEVESPRNQVWFLGQRIWYPKGILLSLSTILSIFSFLILPLLPALAGAGVAGYCVKEGDIRGIPILLLNLAIGVISISI